MNPEEADIGEAVAALMKDLPKPVQDFLLSDERAAVARDLSAKYSLHVDQAGEFERAYIFMLLGIATPEEFVSILSKSGLSQEVVNGLAADVNTRVFMRLRDLERAPAQSTSKIPERPAPLPPPALDYQPPAAPTLPGSPEPAPVATVSAPAQPVPSAPTYSNPPAQTPSAPMPVYAPAPHPAAHQPPPVQGWHPAAAIHIYAPSHGAPYQNPTVHYTQTPAPSVTEPSPIIPTAPEPPPVRESTVPAQPATGVEQKASQPNSPAVPLKKEYAADPYREPIQ